MSVTELIPVALNLSLAVLVLSVGLQVTAVEVNYLIRQPGLLLRSVVSMNVAMPVIAAVAAAVLDLDPAIELAIVALALSPVPPVLPNKQEKAGGSEAYVASLLATMAVLSIVIVPLGVFSIGSAFGDAVSISPVAVLRVVGIGIVVPLLLGVAIRALAPEAERFSRIVSLAGTTLMVVAFIPVLVGVWSLLLSMVGNGALLALAAFSIIGIVVGHFLGGPAEDNRTVLALATATRHPGVAIAIATAAHPEFPTAAAVVIWHLVVGGVVSGPYAHWRTKMHAAASRSKGQTP